MKGELGGRGKRVEVMGGGQMEARRPKQRNHLNSKLAFSSGCCKTQTLRVDEKGRICANGPNFMEYSEQDKNPLSLQSFSHGITDTTHFIRVFKKCPVFLTKSKGCYRLRKNAQVPLLLKKCK